jgi:uncharacterized protein YjbJ (UPF0337 family)
MGETTDKAKGHMKEAVGDLTDDERLEREGKLDQASGDVKGAAEDAKDKVEEGVDAVRAYLESVWGDVSRRFRLRRRTPVAR